MREMDKEREMIRTLAQKTAQKVVGPRASEIDESGEISRDLIESLGKQGLLSILLPEEYGGANGDITSFCLVIEEIAKVCGSSALLILTQGMGSLPIELGGNGSQKERFFTRIAEEGDLIAFALSESAEGPRLATMNTSARKGEKDYLLNGRKCFITNGGIARIYTLFALTQPDRGREGVSAFILEDKTPGLCFGEKEKKIGMRGTLTADLILNECRIPLENLLGEEGEGWKIAMETLHRSGPAVGALAVGLAEGAIDYAIHYANERIQFGRPISSFQAIQFMIADMATHTEAARALVYQAARQIDAHSEGSEKYSAISKVFATDVAMQVTTDAVQILGGYGYMKDYPVERMMRDAKVTQVFGVTNQFQRWMIVQELMKG